MHQLYHLGLAALAACVLPASAWAQADYATNYSNGETSYHSARFTRSVTLASDGTDVLTVNAQPSPGSKLYYDESAQVAKVKPGSTLKVTVDYQGEWMNAYAYVDLNQDKQFSYTVDDASHRPAADSELRSFSFYSFNASSDVSGYNSKGEAVTGNDRSSVVLPEFTAPTTPGSYRVRVKVDWNNIDPAGSTSTSPWGSLQNNGGAIVDFTLEVEGDTPVTPPETQGFTSDFTGDNPAEGWTVVDGNGDGTTWQGDAEKHGVTYDGSNATGAANDLLLTPAFNLVAGQDYIVSAELSQQSAFDPDKVTFSYGYAATAEGQNPIATADLYADNGNGTMQCHYRFTATETGKGYVGVKVETATANGSLTLTSLTVEPVAKAVPNAVSDLSATADAEAGTVTLSWNNPAEDTAGLPISSELTARVYRDGAVVATTEALEPGSPATVTLKPAEMTGTATYEVRAVLGDNESAGTTVSVDLADVKGEEVVVKSFENVNSDNAADWTIEDLGGTSAWRHDYANVFRFDYKLGQKFDNDWLISPAVALETGKRYVAKYELATSRDYAANVDVTLGDAASHEAQTTVLASYPNLKQNGFAQFATNQFTVPTTGDYYFGFHVFDASYSVTMRNLVIYRLDQTTGIGSTEATVVVSYNPQTAWLTAAAGSEVTVYDLQGRVAARYAAVSEGVSLATLPQGAYVVKVAAPGAKAQSVKILK